MADGPGPTVVGFDQTERGVEELDRWSGVARTTLVGEQVPVGQLDLIFVDSDEMAELNLTHMGHSGPTDVLAFPLDADELPLGPADTADARPAPLGDVPVHLGDVVVCREVAEGQASEHCGTVEAELSLLVIHGVLHVLGHDHGEPEETAMMQDRERHHLARYGLEHPVRP